MTLSSRNRLLTFLVVLGLVALVGAVWGGFWALRGGGFQKIFSVQSENLFWFLSLPGKSKPLWVLLLPFVSLIPVALFGLLYFRQVFRKTTAPEAWFFSFFFFFLLLDSLRVWQLSVLEDGTFFGAVFTRGILFLRIASLISFFIASLYALDFPYQRVGSMILGVLALSLVLAALLPLDTQRLDSSLLYDYGDERAMGFVQMGFLALTVFNYFLGVIKRGFRSAWPFFLGAVLMMAGWQLSLFSHPWAPLILVPGALILGRKAQDWYFFQ